MNNALVINPFLLEPLAVVAYQTLPSLMEVVGHVHRIKHQRVAKQPNAAVLDAQTVGIQHAVTACLTSSLIIVAAKPVLLVPIQMVGTLLSA